MKAAIVLCALIFLVGCVGNMEDTIKQLPAIDAFLKEHPGADVKITLLGKEYVSSNIEEFRLKCGPQFQAGDYYYALVEEKGQKIEVYTEKASGEAVCILRTTTRTDDDDDTVKGCTKEYVPVCGFDGNTYGNECMAKQNGVKVDYDGECKTRSIRPIVPIDVKPNVCTMEYAAVCGTDGNTYGNACQADAAGVKIIYKGECGKPSGETISPDQAIQLVKVVFHEKNYKVSDSCGTYNERTGRMEAESVTYEGKRENGFLIYLTAKCGGFIPVTTTFEYIVAFDGSTIVAEGVLSRDNEECTKQGGYWNECPMDGCKEGMMCIQVCGEPRCDSLEDKEERCEAQGGDWNECPQVLCKPDGDCPKCGTPECEYPQAQIAPSDSGSSSGSTETISAASETNGCEVIGRGCVVNLENCLEKEKADYWKEKGIVKGTIDKSYYLDKSGYVCNVDFGTFTQAWPVKEESDWWCGKVSC